MFAQTNARKCLGISIAALAVALTWAGAAQAQIVRDDAGNAVEAARSLPVRRGLARFRGRLDYEGDVDFYGVMAPNAAPLTVELLPSSARSAFSGSCMLYDSAGAEIAAEATDNGLRLDPADGGETYYVAVEGVFSETALDNMYALNVYIPEDKEPNTIAEAGELALRRGTGRTRGNIAFDWDVDVFGVTASSTSPMTVTMTPRGRTSTFDGTVAVRNAAGDVLADDDDPDSGGASLEVDTVRGGAYYVEVSGVAGSTGDYDLKVHSPLDDFGNTIPDAGAPVARRGMYLVQGKLEFRGDVDVLRLSAPSTGQMNVGVAVSRRSPVDPKVTVYAGDGSEIDSASAGAPASPISLSVQVDSGEDYYVEVSDAAGTALDRYTLSATFEEGAPPPPPPPAESVHIDPADNSAVLAGYVTQDLVFETDTDWLSAQLLVTLTSGTVYQDPFGGTTSPNPTLFNLQPSLEFDTYVSNGVVGEPVATVTAEDFNPGAPVQCDEDGISLGWFTTDVDDVGSLPLARITLSDDAAGTFHFRATALSSEGGVDQFDVTGTMANGTMTAD
jgi:hypothetical protein